MYIYSIKNHNNIVQNFKSTPAQKQQTDKKQPLLSNDAQLGLALAGLATIGIATIAPRLLPKKKPNLTTFDEALNNAGVEIKNNIAIIKETGELFTGQIKNQKIKEFNKIFNEVTEYVDGMITEKLIFDNKHYNETGYFYKDGKLRIKVFRIGTACGFSEIHTNDTPGCLGDGIIDLEKSIFDTGRNMLKNLKD